MNNYFDENEFSDNEQQDLEHFWNRNYIAKTNSYVA